MKAAVLHQVGQALQIEEVTVDNPAQGRFWCERLLVGCAIVICI